jgi:hypothetical protein
MLDLIERTMCELIAAGVLNPHPLHQMAWEMIGAEALIARDPVQFGELYMYLGSRLQSLLGESLRSVDGRRRAWVIDAAITELRACFTAPDTTPEIPSNP